MPPLSMLKKILVLFDWYVSSLGIEVVDNEIYFIKIRRTFKRFKILEELKINYKMDQKLSELIKETIRKNNLKSRYYSIQFDVKNVLVRCIEIPAMPLHRVHQYLEQHPELYLPLKLDTNEYQYKLIVQNERPSHLILLLFLFKWDAFNSLITDLREFSYFSFITLNGMSVFFLFPYIYPSFSGYHFHFRKEHVSKFVYHLGYLNLVHYFPNTPARCDWFFRNEQQKPIILSGEEPAAEILAVDNVEIFSLQKIIRGYQREYLNALGCSLLVFFMGIHNANAYGIFPEKEFFIQKRRSILFRLIWLLYFLGIIIVLFAQLIQSGIETRARYMEPNRIKHQSLIQKRDQLLSQQNQLKNIWSTYLKQQEVKNKTSKDLYILLKCIPPHVKLSHLELKTQKSNSSVIHLRGYCLAQIELMNFLKNLENSPSFSRVLLQQLQIKEFKNYQIKWLNNFKQCIEFQVIIES